MTNLRCSVSVYNINEKLCRIVGVESVANDLDVLNLNLIADSAPRLPVFLRTIIYIYIVNTVG